MPYGQPKIPIGQFREKVAIQQAVTADDGMGGQTVTKWKTVSEPWAKVEALDERQKEALLAQQIAAKHAYFVYVRYNTTVSADCRIIIRDTTMQIHSVVDDLGTRERKVIQAVELQA